MQVLLGVGANPNVYSKKKEVPLIQSFDLKKRNRPGSLAIAQLIVLSGRANLDLGAPAEHMWLPDDAAPIIQLVKLKLPIHAEPFVHLLTFHGCDVNVRECVQS